MPTLSNLYAEKVYAEHPLSLWSLDDSVSYVSILAESDRNISTTAWTKIFCTAQQDSILTNSPFTDSYTTRITADMSNFAEDSRTLSAIGPDLAMFTDLDQSLSTFAVSAYFYADSQYFNSVEIGYEYDDVVSGTTVTNTRNFPIGIFNKWVFVSETFQMPNQATYMRPVIRATYLYDASGADNDLLVNGLAMGQWSEEFASSNLGELPISLSSDIALSVEGAVPAAAYGLSDTDGYYLVNNNALVAKNSGIPMVYGASSVTNIYHNPNNPSAIFPAYDFLNEAGKYKTMTAEFWARITSNTATPKKIFGPIASGDGLYVSDAFLICRVGNYSQSYFVGEWVRPMLINFRYSPSQVSVLINGDQAISFEIDASSISFPELADENGKSQNWIGFYAYEDVPLIEIDSVAIYSYKVPAVVAKRRWVYGQGVELPENINRSYSGSSVVIDYDFADYTNSYSYPKTSKWGHAIVDNFSTQEGYLSSPNYSLPEFQISNKSYDNLVSSIQTQNEDDTYFSFRPSSEWDNTAASIYFDSLNKVYGGAYGVYGVFKATEQNNLKQVLLLLKDNVTGNQIKVELATDQIEYSYIYNGVEQVFYIGKRYLNEEQFPIGMHFERMSDYFGGNVASILGRSSYLSMYVGGDGSAEGTFSGNIYKIGILGDRSLAQALDIFNSRGVVFSSVAFGSPEDGEIDAGLYSTEFWRYMLDGGSPAAYATNFLLSLIPSYALTVTKTFETYFFDIEALSYWEDSIPLMHFAQYVTDKKGSSYYDLDFLQFNINYPAPATYAESIVDDPNGWTYNELYNEFSNPTQLDYDILGNSLYTQYQNYEELASRTTKSYNYDTSNSIVKTYITFQYLQSGANTPSSSYSNTVLAPKNGIVTPGDEWLTTKYEVVDNMIIYPPAGINFEDLAIVTHIESINPGIITNPVKIRKLEYVSQAFNDAAPNVIGTKYGMPVYPYKKSGFYYDYKSVNPFSIYKGSTPYLYLTRNSGIQTRGQISPLEPRGFMVPMNQNKASNYKVIAMQTAIRYDEDFFPYGSMQIMEIEAKNKAIKVFMSAVDTSGKRARIYAVDGYTGQLEDGIAFYINGNVVKDATITVKEWSMLGISFAESLDISNYTGYIRTIGPLTFNLMSTYESTNLQEVQETTIRPWFRVQTIADLETQWDFWNDYYIWRGVLVVSSRSFYGVDPSDIYKTYTGTNKITASDNIATSIGGYRYIIRNGTTVNQISAQAI